MTPISKIKKCYIMRIKMLVYVVWAFVLALGVQSCHQPDVLPEAVRYPILFGSSDSRAVATKDDLKTDGFRVHAYFKGEGAATFDHDVNYQKVNGEDIWALSNPEYWIPGVTYWFKAFYPKDLDVDITINVGASQSYSITDYDIRTQMDIMVASADALTVPENGWAPTSGSVVDLNFQHLLANVVVKIKAEINVTIYDVTLKFVPVKGSYTDGSWSCAATQGNVEMIGLNKALNSSNNEFQDVTDGGFLVFPNSIGDAELYIRTSDKTYELPLPTTPNQWFAGNRYAYTLIIKQNDILFDEPTVEEWDEENATGSVVIK